MWEVLSKPDKRGYPSRQVGAVRVERRAFEVDGHLWKKEELKCQ